MKIAVVGAGIIGTLTAYFLARKGHEVIVYERESRSAMKCSFANGGQISVCNAQTWNTWPNVVKGLKWMLSKDAPLLIRPMPTLPKITWLLGFLRHTLNGSHVPNTIETIRLGQQSSALYDEIIAEEGLRFDQSKCGLLHVYTDPVSLTTASSHRALFEDHGVEWKYVSRDEIIHRDMAMASFKGLQGGILTSTDWTGDAHMFCNELQKILRAKYGVQFCFQTEILNVSGDSVETPDGEEHGFAHVVLANGHEIVKFSSQNDDFLNIYPVKGYSVTIEGVGCDAPHISLLDDDRKIVSSRLGDRLRIAGTAELNGSNQDIVQHRIQPLLDWCHRNFPGVNTSEYTPWACLRPMNSNMMPIVRQSHRDGLWYHGGHGHLGWTLGAATSYILAETLGS